MLKDTTLKKKKQSFLVFWLLTESVPVKQHRALGHDMLMFVVGSKLSNSPTNCVNSNTYCLAVCKILNKELKKKKKKKKKCTR